MQFHWKVLAWMGGGVVLGLAFQATLEAPAWSGVEWKAAGEGLEVTAAAGPASKGGLNPGDVYDLAILDRGQPDERRHALAAPGDFESLLAESENGEVLWLVPAGGDEHSDAVSVALGMDPTSDRALAIAPFEFVGDLFMALLKMLIVPLVLSSIVTGVAGVGTMKDLRRLGLKTFAYYVSSSMLAIFLGQALVNLIRPGDGAVLGLSPSAAAGTREESFIEVIKRAIPENVLSAMTQNGAMLQIIFFALLLGYFITRAPDPHGRRVREFFASFFEVMMKMAEGILTLLPYGVFALLVKVVAGTGIKPILSLLVYMGTVALALVLHFCVTLPFLLKVIGGISPVRWFKAMSPALMTAFSTSSSSMTLPVSLKTVEERGKVSNKVTSFTLPLGATINMDGTALYECIGVIFLAQYYASMGGEPLTLSAQALVVVMALLASIGAAGIPSAGLVMMLTILSALNLPLEGAALLLAVDRPLDMMRTVVNVWSDSCGAAVISRSEGEEGPLSAGSSAA
ncbi:MAG: dicarboxylate/amino acid:cation symporter [Planctomycetota bacterium]|jgi:Na+/H+-dicarboxylate symporter|nr:dicarboxylate/amino acid:cation symporter [Planctomycetota bacterium]MDP6763985.1 dicarboxylate/amino acid:cation symporter [Planctomycetota bacterium]MDP6988352.1 dicarboxylate/amino acid:cation symporter [Planctomycetota bacterium]